ncbi:MICOS complex subunit MIC27-like isoform X3 [Homalodisca vitripennis]|uniref:MICOS complex subunit MIC27-like isoform X3 n=2 Tax=Homalodisca vitripennis TaxID=197043 RepID=UPI001EEBA517|nr:MICOS complex subunit MIC27-like isoform X3 [Homalodisca vitripennis]
MYHKMVVKRIIVPVSSSVLLAATVVASSDSKDKQEKKNLIRARDLSIYSKPAQQTNVQEETEPKSQSALLSVVRQVREGVWAVSDQFNQVSSQFNNIVETGKAHTSSTIQILREEDNYPQRYGAIAAGGLLGYVIAIRRGWFRRIIYTGTGATAVAAICYPEEAKEYSSEGFKQAKRYIVIAYHFLNGASQKTQGSASSGKASKKNQQDTKPEPQPTSYSLPDPGHPVVDHNDDLTSFYSRRA